MGRLIGTTTQYSFLPGVTYSNGYGYDAASNRTSFTAPDGSTVNYAYDTLSRLTSLTDSVTGQFTFGYDALSRRTSLDRPNGVNTTYAYDALSNLQSILHKLGVNTLDGATYTYDPTGNRASKTNLLNSAVSNFSYDSIYQLAAVTGPNPESYTYDPVGNRLSSQNVPSYTYNSSNELTGDGSATYTYDGNGNTQTKTDSSGTTTYSWDFENRLTSVQLPGSTTVTFKYDPFGRRIQKGSIVYLYEGANLIEEADGTGAEVARYAFGPSIDEPLAVMRGGTTEFYQADGLGSVTSLSTNTSTISDTFVYDSFGNLTAASGAFAQPFRFTGREWDGETGLYYYRARYYDPSAGRFLSEDPLMFKGSGVNFYNYVGNNSPTLLDPLGLSPSPKRWPNARTRSCNAVEYSRCAKICGSKGVESCRVSQTFRVVRWKDGKTLWKWADGPMSCSCNEECEKTPKPQPVPFRIPIVDPLADWLRDRWNELKNWKPPQPNPGWGPSPFPLPPIPVFP